VFSESSQLGVLTGGHISNKSASSYTTPAAFLTLCPEEEDDRWKGTTRVHWIRILSLLVLYKCKPHLREPALQKKRRHTGLQDKYSDYM